MQRTKILAGDHAVGRDFRAVLLEDIFCIGFAVQVLIDQVCVLAAENKFQFITHQCVLVTDLRFKAILRQLFKPVEDIVQ